MNNDFLPQNYSIPEAPSNYMSLEDGENTFRVMSSAVVGYEYFNTDNKPVRSKTAFEDMPTNIKKDGKIKPFWAFVVWNYKAERHVDLEGKVTYTGKIQILELTQKTIMNYIKDTLVDNPKWGNPKMYDITVNKDGTGFDTKYSTTGEPPLGAPTAEIQAIYEATYVNLDNLFLGLDPFTK